MARVSPPDDPQVKSAPQGQPTVRVPKGAKRLSGPLTLRDGLVVGVRPIQPDDTQRLVAFHARLSPETIEYRYFGSVPVLAAERAEQLTHVDYENRMALVATTGFGASEQIIAVVRYERMDPTTAEVAFVVEDQWQGQGISTQLLYRLAAYAHRLGFTTFLAEIMSTNVRMRNVLRKSGFPFTTRYVDGCVEMRLDITVAPTAPCAPREGAGAPTAAQP